MRKVYYKNSYNDYNNTTDKNTLLVTWVFNNNVMLIKNVATCVVFITYQKITFRSTKSTQVTDLVKF